MRLVETIDASGEIGPAVAILEAHRVGAAHRAISIVVWNAARTKMLITRRAAEKATWPSFWSNAVCSHPLPREEDAAAARRRLREEIRVDAAVAPAFRLHYGPVQCPVSGAFEHELDHVFYATWAENQAIDANPEEISETRWVDRAELTALREAGALTPWFGLILDRVSWAN